MEPTLQGNIPLGPKPPVVPPRPEAPLISEKPRDVQYGKMPTLAAPVMVPVKPQPSLSNQKPSPIKSEDVVIRTMQDDLQQVRASHVALPPVLSQPSTPKTNRKASLPLPAGNNNGQSIVIPPQKRPRSAPSRSRIVIGIVALILVLMVGAGAFWVYSNPSKIATLLPAGEAKPIGEMIPANANSIVEYQMADQESRNDIKSFWSLQSQKQPSITSLLEGDPRLLLGYEDVKQIYFITLPSETRPYVLVPHTESTATIFSESIAGQISDKNGWYIAHSVSVSSYEQSLTQGTLKDSDILKVNTSSPYRFFVYSKADVAQQAAESIISSNFAPAVKDFSLWSGLQPNGSGIPFQGVIHADKAIGIDKIDDGLVKYVPVDATYVWMGGSLASELSELTDGILDSNILSQPQVKQFLSQLSGPFLYYQKPQQSTNLNDVGIVITLPTLLKEQLKIGDQGIENALPALMPLTGDNNVSGASLAFTETIYNGLALRYVNILGPGRALDYTISGNYLVIATSKDSMLELIDRMQAIENGGAVQTASFSEITQHIAANSQASKAVIAQIAENATALIIPGYKLSTKPFIGFSLQPLDQATISIDGFLATEESVAP